MTKQYHLMFPNIETEAVLSVRQAIKNGLFKRDKSIEERKEILYSLHVTLCSIYDLEVVNIDYVDNFWGTGGYNLITNIITLDKVSLVTYLHEFCHYMKITKHQKNSESIARGWSISLFYLATPILCKRAIKNGLIIHQKKIKEEL